VIEMVRLAMFISLCMAVFLIYSAYWEGIRIANQNEKVNGFPFLIMSILGFIFALFASHFHHLT
jgi:hypothetical protein